MVIFSFINIAIGRDSPGSGIPAHFLNAESRDWRCFNPGIIKNEQNAQILHDICQKMRFSQILGAISGSKAESERTRPQHQLRDHGGHRSTGAIMLNKLFMRLRMLLYSISLDV